MTEPTFASLLKGNLRVLVGVAVLAALAFGAWRGLLLVFPDVDWLRVPKR